MPAAAADPETAPETPRVVHSLPGRVRIHVPSADPDELERRLGELRGVQRVRASGHTQNVLVRFDQDETDEASILDVLSSDPEAVGSSARERSAGARTATNAIKAAAQALPKAAAQALPKAAAQAVPKAAAQAVPKRVADVPSYAVREVGRLRRRARIAVRGIDRDPELAERAVERLTRLPGVSRVTASQLTGRVLVEYYDHLLSIEDLLLQVTKLELPELPGEETPSHPLDPAPLIQSTARVVGAALGLGFTAARRAAAGPQAGPQSGGRGAQVAGAVGILEGLPPVERRVEELIGRNATQLALSGLTIVSLTFAGSPLGLAVTGASALRLMTTVRARRNAWRRYEQRLDDAEPPHPGAEVEIEAGERVPLPATVLRGFGTAISAGGDVLAAAPGAHLDAGARPYGGPVTVRLDTEEPFFPQPRATPPTPTIYDRYLTALPPVSLAYAALTALLTRSPARALTTLLLVNPRAALIGAESADNGAAARILRQDVTVVGSRERRPISVPDALIIESPRVLAGGLEILEVTGRDRDEVLRLAAGIAAAAGSPWGPAFNHREAAEAVDGTFDGRVASAEIDGERWLLAPARAQHASARAQHAPTSPQNASANPQTTPANPQTTPAHLLELRPARLRRPVGRIALRLTPAPGLEQLAARCREANVPIEVVAHPGRGATALCAEHGIREIEGDALDRVREIQARGGIVAVVSDRSHAGPEFAECDLAIGLSSGRSGHFAARADLLAPDLSSVAAIIDAGARRDVAVRDSVLLSAMSNAAGAIWGLGGNPRFERGSQATYVGALAAIGGSFVRLRGGARARSVAERLSDPAPERFGRLSVDDVLAALRSRPEGLTNPEAASRHTSEPEAERRSALASSALEQLNSPLTAVLAGGGVISLALGAAGDALMIAAVIAANTAVGVWQERQAGKAAEALQRMSARTAKVLRDGELITIDADDLVPGDVLVLGPGDRVAADARLIESDELEVDEAALTGESVPVEKAASGGTDASRVVLEGSDVTVGTAQAVVIAVGRGTRMGATAAAIALEETRSSPLGQKLGRMFGEGLPLIAAGGALVTVGGLLWGRPLVPQLALGASVAIGAVPEGLPLLAGVAQAAVARRLAANKALVRRLSAVEALGRVDVACTDKTGTLTEGRPAVTCVADAQGDWASPDELTDAVRPILEAAALASPHPDTPTLEGHPTDVAVVEAAARAGLTGLRDAPRDDEQPFEPSRGFHATRSSDRLFVKGAAEVLVSRCTSVRQDGRDKRLSASGSAGLLETVERLSGQGLRVLMVAEGSGEQSIEEPHDLTAIGFLGISDPLRPGVKAAVERCETAGVRVVMLTGDHPATAQALAREAGLTRNGADLLTGDELSSLADDELDQRLEHARVIARISPLDKLRIVEALQRRGHVVAMTGDGVNDAPALRLADVGVAMGRSGTDVAREAADLVLAEDDFSTLVEAFVEGRGFWHNIRRALSLMLGGNAGELGLMIAAGVTGLAAPLTTRQVLAVNLVTDVLPALSVAVQEPEHRNLAGLSREGTAALDAPLRRGILNRGVATSVPSFVAYALTPGTTEPARRRAVAFTCIVASQLAQTLDLGRAEGRLSPEVLGAVAASGAFVLAAQALPPFQRFFGLALPTPFGGALCAAAILGSLAISRWLSSSDHLNSTT